MLTEVSFESVGPCSLELSLRATRSFASATVVKAGGPVPKTLRSAVRFEGLPLLLEVFYRLVGWRLALL
jgi:hypothetical protein